MKVDGNYIELSREEHNYWAKPSANVGAGPYTFRVTLADNTVIEAENVTIAVPDDDEGDTFSTGSQVVTQG